MKKTILLLLAVLLFCSGCSGDGVVGMPSGSGYASDHGRAKLSKANQDAVKKRMKIVEAELATLKDHPWAGTYAKGGGLGAHWKFVIAPKGGYAYTCYSGDCIDENGHLLYDQNYGEVTWEDGRLKLSPAIENDGRENNFECVSEYALINWDGRLCLIPADGFIEFCNYFNHGYANCFMRDGSWGRPRPTGKPDIPEQFKPYLLDQPIEGQVITVGEMKEFRRQSSMV